MPIAEQPPTDPAVPALPPRDTYRGAAELRGLHRFAVATPAELRCKRRRFAVQIVDTSGEGCAFTIKEDPGLNLGDHAELRTDSAVLQIEVVSRTALDAKSQSIQRAKFRFGVRRLWDEPLPVKSERPDRGLAFWLQRSCSPLGNNSTTLFAFIAVALMVGFIVWWAFSGTSKHQQDESLGSTFFPTLFPPAKKAVATARPANDEKNSVFWNWMAAGQPGTPATAQAPAKNPGDTEATAAAGTEASYGGLVATTVGAGKLTPQQEASLQQIGKIADAAITALAKNSEVSGEEATRRREMLLEAARQEVLRVLSPEQRAAWEKDRTPSR